MKILFTWLGGHDIRASEGDPDAGLGPIGRTVDVMTFDEIHILNNYDRSKGSLFMKWLKQRKAPRAITLHQESLTNPMEFGEIYEAARREIDKVLQKNPDAELSFHLSPGTSAMAAVWVILAKTRYAAELLQSSPEEGVKVATIPFDIAAEYIPDLLRRADERLEDLSGGTITGDPGFESVLFQSRVMKESVHFARRIAIHDVPVLITGESGTGKEVFARSIHQASSRRDGPFIAINCGAISEQLIESELFGHVKNAFTGANADRAGHFVAANSGTIFLDEVGELPLPAQVKLLRVLQEGEVMPVGTSKTKKIDVRVISATNRNMLEEIMKGNFREDLFYRLAVFVLDLPPLRERDGDIGLLADYFLGKLNQKNQGIVWSAEKKLSPQARNVLQRHDWPGNIRELEHTIYRAAVMSDSARISDKVVERALFARAERPSDLLSHQLGNGFDLQALIAKISHAYLARALVEANNNKSKAAQLVGLPSYQTFTNWMERYGVKETER